MATPTKRFAALDTSFLLGLAVGDDACQEVVDWLSQINFYPLATCTVLQELADIEREEQDPFEVQNAIKAQRSLSTWGILDAALAPIDNGIARIAAGRLVEKKVLPDRHENDGLVIAEAALLNCQLLITFRETLLNALSAGIRFMLIECDLPDLFVVCPADILAYLRKAEAERAGAKP